MSDIKFIIKGYKVPLILELEVDGTNVTYRQDDNGVIHFTVWVGDAEKALSIVDEIIKQIKLEHDDAKNGVSWRTLTIEITAETDWYTCVDWQYYVRDAG